MKIKDTEYLLRTQFLDLKATEYEDNNGNQKFWVWAQRPSNKKAVVIVAVVDKGFRVHNKSSYKRDLRLVVIKERRIPIQDFEYGFPAGLVNDGEDPIEAAKRELTEETNLELKRVIQVSPYVYNSAGLTDESAAIVFCEAEGKASTKNNEASEDIEVILANQEQIQSILENKEAKIGAKAWIIFNQFIGRSPF